ncbi:hypothetical protein B296_00000263 [Ensete ventricosum]|uniref:Uncharacterized protein n=1 Tax=Ensete ventricosum TaxID=4639 RepID=A0A427AS84_ENSVE|nr:hypothetical protein B296_00000263 [Ensete ventricosum]
MALCMAHDSGRVHLHCFMSCTPLFAIPQVPLLMQNDLVHGWGLDFALRKCVEPAHEKIGVVDSQWIVHQVVPSLGNQVRGQPKCVVAMAECLVRERCRKEWGIFRKRLSEAEKAYYLSKGITSPNSTGV